MKALKWIYRAYRRPANATVGDLQRLTIIEDVLKAAKDTGANRSKE
jgi:hypothetical protein